MHKVGPSSALQRDGERLHVEVEGRYVSVVRHDGRLFCLDSTCYHTGGPLANGDIEEVHGMACITCPWHHYHITLEDGAKLYETLVMGPNKKLVPGGIKKKERAQRVHKVERRADGIYVQLDTTGACDSDHYGHSAMCGQQLGAAMPGGNRQRIHSALPLRSGHVLQGNGSGGASESLVALSGGGGGGAMPPPQHKLELETELEGVALEEEEEDEEVEAGDVLEALAGAQPSPGHTWDEVLVQSATPEGSDGARLVLRAGPEDERGPLLRRLLAFAADDTGAVLDTRDLLTSRHVRVGLVVDGELVQRPFTPLSSARRGVSKAPDAPLLELSVRVYTSGELTPRLLSGVPSLQLARGTSEFATDVDPAKLPPLARLQTLYLFAGGSGITPMLQLLENAIDRAAPASLKVVLVLANVSVQRALGLDRVAALAAEAAAQGSGRTDIRVVNVLSSAPDEASAKPHGEVVVGARVQEGSFLRSIGVGSAPGAEIFAACGPEAMLEALRGSLTGAFGLAPEAFVEFQG